MTAVSIIFLSCTPALTQKNKPYTEDLSVLRPKILMAADTASDTNHHNSQNFTPILIVNERVDAVLDSIDRFNKTRLFVDGFTIQLYSGPKREEAMNVKKKMMEEAEDLGVDIQYFQPKFRVKTGNYFTRIEAQRDLFRLKKKFPNSILVPEKIALK